MKKNISILFLILLASSQYNSAQIPNADFEFWTATDSFDVPSNWVVNNFGSPNSKTYKDDESYSGDYSINLAQPVRTKLFVNTGFPISYHPHVLNGFYRAHVLGWGDSLMVKVLLYNNYIPIDSGTWLFDQISVMEWSPLVVNISNNSIVADSAAISLQCNKHSAAETYINLWVDHLFFDDDDNSVVSISNSYLNIFPNPASSEIYINSSLQLSNQSFISIKNSLGQTLISTKAIHQNHVLDISSLEPGIYFMEVKNEETIVVKKFIKD